MKNIVINRESGQHSTVKFVGSLEDAYKFIDEYNHAHSSRRIRKFDPENYRKIQICPAGFGSDRLIATICKESSIEDYKAARRKEKQGAKKQSQKGLKEYLEEMTEPLKGWYHVEMDVYVQDFENAGYKVQGFTGKCLGNSMMDAYNKAVKEVSNDPAYMSCDAPEDAVISYIGTLR